MNTSPACRDARAFAAQALEAAPLLVLTGAGISTGCGIPTYRDERGTWLRSEPITHREFTGDPRQRQRYWGRSALGWPAVHQAEPSAAHRALPLLEGSGHVAAIVTQNVDRLHQKAGSHHALDLHGRLDRVRCLECDAYSAREAVQLRLLGDNPWLDRPVSSVRPDGDADLSEAEVDQVVVPGCERCAGTLMPDVVFFGGSIPRQRVSDGQRALAEARALLVIGSSLQVYSGYRFCRQAHAAGKQIFIINPGITRADVLASARLAMDADSALQAMAQCSGTSAAGVPASLGTP